MPLEKGKAAGKSIPANPSLEKHGGHYPLQLEELLSEVGEHPAVVSSPDQLLDPWGALFPYERIDEGLPLDIRLSTLGRDGCVGGTGEDADLHFGRGRWDDDF